MVCNADLSSDVHPSLAAARMGAQLGVPSIAVALGTPSPGAPLQPALQAAAEVAVAAVAALRAEGGWPRARNLPRVRLEPSASASG
jgi:hypothetical protein